MARSDDTKAALMAAARNLFWARGFSNVSVRDVAAAAGVDVALISRYFGSKQGLFEATLMAADVIDLSAVGSAQELADRLTHLFAHEPRQPGPPSILTMFLLNAADPEVGEVVRRYYQDRFHTPVTRALGDPGRAALLSAAVFGFGVAEKSLRLPGIAAPGTADYEAQFRQLLGAALGP